MNLKSMIEDLISFMGLEDIEQRQRKAQLLLRNQKGIVNIELADIEKIEKVTGSNKAAKKLFMLSLIKANEQAIHNNGQLTKDYVSFPLQELVDIGFYKSLRSASTGFFSEFGALTSIKIGGKVQKNKKQKGVRVLFTGARIENGQCYVFFNPYINWSFLIQYYNDDK